jgi:Domain of unknown function (DUF4417)
MGEQPDQLGEPGSPSVTQGRLGTRTSQFWAQRPGGFDKLNLSHVYPGSGRWDIPALPAATVIPAKLVAYSDRGIISRTTAGAVHFFLDDYRFETCWSYPDRALQRISKLGVALTPDFSIWADMPRAMQLWQVYRSRWFGAYMVERGIEVIPTVGWGHHGTFEFCWAGIAPESVVAVSTVGTTALDFSLGWLTLLDKLRPSRILLYGKPHPYMTQDNIVRYPTRWEEIRWADAEAGPSEKSSEQPRNAIGENQPKTS